MNDEQKKNDSAGAEDVYAQLIGGAQVPRDKVAAVFNSPFCLSQMRPNPTNHPKPAYLRPKEAEVPAEVAAAMDDRLFDDFVEQFFPGSESPKSMSHEVKYANVLLVLRTMGIDPKELRDCLAELPR